MVSVKNIQFPLNLAGSGRRKIPADAFVHLVFDPHCDRGAIVHHLAPKLYRQHLRPYQSASGVGEVTQYSFAYFRPVAGVVWPIFRGECQ